MRVAAIQTTAGVDRDANLAAAGGLVDRAAADGATLVVLPEYFSVAGTPGVLRAGAEHLDGPTMTWAASIASRLGIHLVAGSFPERTGRTDGRLANTSCLVGPDGATLAVYRKVHLFDVALEGVEFRESDTIAPGNEVVVAPLDGADGPADHTAGTNGEITSGDTRPAVLGLSLCYDIRFPELYRMLTLAGATVVAVPAAFTAATGPAHWELLLRARAVEDQVFVIGAGQVGELPPGMPRGHGHSMVVDPWGTVLAERTDPTPGNVLVDLDFARLSDVRSRLPVLANRRPAAYVGLHGNERGTTN
jgi:predicted amidohydrolase